MCFSVAVSVYFENSTYSVKENERIVQVTLALNISSSFNITVHLLSDVNGSSATPDEDYNWPINCSVIFNNNTKKATLNISITNDTLLEDDEKFTLIINSSSLPNYVHVGDQSTTTVTIVNDDCK